MIVVRDSIIVIHHLVFKTLPKDPHLNRLLCHTEKLLEGLKEIKFLHVMRGLNQPVDAIVNKACSLPLS
jgi:hypothetical protein